jgi:shikimate dehydrogenase
MITLGLIGYPLGHSLSPIIHNAALDACGLEGSYSLFPIRPDNLRELAGLLDRCRRGEVRGLNVTIPHKQTVIPLLDRLTPTAEAIGAVNTIFMQSGKLTGDNTDAAGFLADLHNFLNNKSPNGEQISSRNRTNEQADPPAGTPRHALVLGAGGSARAVAYALLMDGWHVTLAARRLEQAQELCGHFLNHASRLAFVEFQAHALSPLVSSLHLVVNTTPVGMAPNIAESPWPENLPYPPQASVYDLVYNPPDTNLMLDARAAGLPATTGLGMLVEQAALSFQLWTGHDVARERLLDALSFA